MDEFARSDAYVKESRLGFDEAVAVTVANKWTEKYHWLYHYDVCALPIYRLYVLAVSELYDVTGAKRLERSISSGGCPPGSSRIPERNEFTFSTVACFRFQEYLLYVIREKKSKE